MLKKIFLFNIVLLFFTTNALANSVDKTQTGIPLDTVWKQKVYAYAKENVKHSAWGIAHSERDYQLSVMLAKQENMQVDTDVLFAAAFFHDIGAISPFKKKEIEHSIRSVEIAKPLLQAYGFPMQKWPKVKAAILGHMYYAEKPTIAEAILFHDADAVDFFGTIGVVRLVSITERGAWSPSLAGAFTTLAQFKVDVPPKLITHSAKQMTKERILEMEPLLASLNRETFDGAVL